MTYCRETRDKKNAVRERVNEPLVLKVREIIFFLRAKHTKGHFEGFFFRGPRPFDP
jgi:hypothetical protein